MTLNQKYASTVGEILVSLGQEVRGAFDWGPTSPLTIDSGDENGNPESNEIDSEGELRQDVGLSEIDDEQIVPSEPAPIDMELALKTLEEAELYVKSVEKAILKAGSSSLLKAYRNEWHSHYTALSTIPSHLESQLKKDGRGFLINEKWREEFVSFNHALEDLDPASKEDFFVPPITQTSKYSEMILEDAKSAFVRIRRHYEAQKSLPRYDTFQKSIDEFRLAMPEARDVEYSKRRAKVLVRSLELRIELESRQDQFPSIPSLPSPKSFKSVSVGFGDNTEFALQWKKVMIDALNTLERLKNEKDYLAELRRVKNDELNEVRAVLGFESLPLPQLNELFELHDLDTQLLGQMQQTRKDLLNKIEDVDLREFPDLFEQKLKIAQYVAANDSEEDPMQDSNGEKPNPKIQRPYNEQRIEDAVAQLLDGYDSSYQELKQVWGSGEQLQRQAMELAKMRLREKIINESHSAAICILSWEKAADVLRENASYADLVYGLVESKLISAEWASSGQSEVRTLMTFVSSDKQDVANAVNDLLKGVAPALSRKVISECKDRFIDSAFARQFFTKYHARNGSAEVLQALEEYDNNSVDRLEKLLAIDPVAALNEWASEGTDYSKVAALAVPHIEKWFREEHSVGDYNDYLNYFSGYANYYPEEWPAWVEIVANKTISRLENDDPDTAYAKMILDLYVSVYAPKSAPDLQKAIENTLNERRDLEIERATEADPPKAISLLKTLGNGWQDDPRVTKIAQNTLKYFKKDTLDELAVARFVTNVAGVGAFQVVVDEVIQIAVDRLFSAIRNGSLQPESGRGFVLGTVKPWRENVALQLLKELDELTL